ncbi:unnamed protein product [Bemisia tabaci]|uniref:CRAL-TRIO domain-containing protein n=1 Tax=Bemisia tabaci TaxID=7038 RepID=A0A9P0AJ76_BEMTA|nr:unnamed protein product [Bemisia tabaci]
MSANDSASCTDVIKGRGKELPKKEVERIAQDELRETKNVRETALQQFREWVAKNKDISSVRTDASFLLRFLRVKKFSLPMAQQTLLKYLNLRKTLSHYFSLISYEDAALMHILTNGFIFASPIRDSLGRRVIIYVIDKFDPYKYGCGIMAQVFLMTFETVLEDDVTQITGVTHFADLHGASAAYVTLWSPLEFVRAVRWGEQSMPMRNKCVNIFNCPTSVRYILDFCRGLLSTKLKSRFFIHDSIDGLKSKIDAKCLPKEYGGEIPMSEMLELWKKEVWAKKDLILANKEMQIHDTSGIQTRKSRSGCQPLNNTETNIMAVSGSFRQLNVD